MVTTPLSLLFGWIVVLLLDRFQTERKRIAAKMQEQFDYELFGIQWNEIRCSMPLDTERPNEAAETFERNKKKYSHRD